MTTPERIWAWCYIGERDQGRWSLSISGTGAEYVLLNPAVLAELPEVKALIRAETERCAKIAEAEGNWHGRAIAAAIREGRG